MPKPTPKENGDKLSNDLTKREQMAAYIICSCLQEARSPEQAADDAVKATDALLKKLSE